MLAGGWSGHVVSPTVQASEISLGYFVVNFGAFVALPAVHLLHGIRAFVSLRLLGVGDPAKPGGVPAPGLGR